MASVDQLGQLARELGSIGISGRNTRPKDPAADRVASAMQKETDLLKRSVMTLTQHNRAGPDWEFQGEYTIKAEDADSLGMVTVNHGKGIILPRWVEVRRRYEVPLSTQPDLFGTYRVVLEDKNNQTFQFDKTAVQSKMVVTLIPYRSHFQPLVLDTTEAGIQAGLGPQRGRGDGLPLGQFASVGLDDQPPLGNRSLGGLASPPSYAQGYTGAGAPGGVVAAPPGSVYTDTTNGDLYYKQSGTGTSGWKRLADFEDLPPVHYFHRAFRSALPLVGDFPLIADTAYWVYMGHTSDSFVLKYIEWYVSTAGTGLETAEVCIASGAGPPNKSGRTMTKLIATTALDSLISTGVKRNSSSFNYTVAEKTHLYVGIRTNMGGLQPGIWGLGSDLGQGWILSTASAGVLTSGTSWMGSIISMTGTGPFAPGLTLVRD